MNDGSKASFLSFIIPVYNAEAFLVQCLDSILNQNFSDFEVICINDGSTDGSLKILDSYGIKDKRVKVLSKANEGPASARNIGLNMAKGNYIWFIDADDWIADKSIEIIKEHTSTVNPDVLGFGAYTFNNRTKKIDLEYYRNQSIIPKQHLNTIQSINTCKDYIFELPVEAWCRVYKYDFLKNNKIIFDKMVWGIDDGVFVAECFIKAKKIKNIQSPLYFYRVSNPKSIVYLLKGAGRKTYRSSVYCCKKIEAIIYETKTPIDNVERLLDRNLLRMAYYLNRAKLIYKFKMYYEIKDYLQNSSVLKHNFIKKEQRYNLFFDIRDRSFFVFWIKKFVYNITYNSCSFYIKINILGIEIYRQSKKVVNKTEIKKFQILGIPVKIKKLDFKN